MGGYGIEPTGDEGYVPMGSKQAVVRLYTTITKRVEVTMELVHSSEMTIYQEVQKQLTVEIGRELVEFLAKNPVPNLIPKILPIKVTPNNMMLTTEVELKCEIYSITLEEPPFTYNPKHDYIYGNNPKITVQPLKMSTQSATEVFKQNFKKHIAGKVLNQETGEMVEEVTLEYPPIKPKE